MSKIWSILNALLAVSTPLYAPFIEHHVVLFGAIVTGANAVLHYIAPNLTTVK